jgi:hypothetical protein
MSGQSRNVVVNAKTCEITKPNETLLAFPRCGRRLRSLPLIPAGRAW